MADKVYDIRLVKQKIERYCAYQERSQYEVETKLKSFGLKPDTIDHLIVELIQKNFLNEMRFAEAYVSGKVRIKKWGRTKIRLKLKEKRVGENCINKALSTIDDNAYTENLKELAESLHKKYARQSKSNSFELKAKVSKALYSRGYEWDLIHDVVNELI